MEKRPRNYPETMPSPESGRPMTRGEKEVSFKVAGKTFSYLQPGWWCSLTDADDMDGQLVDDDNQIAEMARRTAKALAHGQKLRRIRGGSLRGVPAEEVMDRLRATDRNRGANTKG